MQQRSAYSLVLLALVQSGYAASCTPSSAASSLISALQSLTSDCNKTKDLVNNYDRSSGINGALSIQTTEGAIAADAKSAVSAMKALGDLNDCDSQAIVSALGDAAPAVRGTLDALVKHASDLIGVGTQTIVANDLTSLEDTSVELAQAFYSKFSCPYTGAAAEGFQSMADGFAAALKAYDATGSSTFPATSSCAAASSGAPATSAPAPASSAPAAASSAPTPASSAAASATSVAVSSAAAPAGTSSAAAPAGTSAAAVSSAAASAQTSAAAPTCTGTPSDTVTSAVSVLQQLGSDSDKTKDLVNGFDSSSGINGALSIQTTEAAIADDAKKALSAIQGLDKLDACDSIALAKGLSDLAPHITGILNALIAKSQDLIAVGTQEIVQNDLIQLQSTTADLETASYKALACPYAAQAGEGFATINSAFNDAIAKYDGTFTSEFPSAPSCPGSSSGSGSTNGTAITSGAAGEAYTTQVITVTEGSSVYVTTTVCPLTAVTSAAEAASTPFANSTVVAVTSTPAGGAPVVTEICSCENGSGSTPAGSVPSASAPAGSIPSASAPGSNPVESAVSRPSVAVPQPSQAAESSGLAQSNGAAKVASLGVVAVLPFAAALLL